MKKNTELVVDLASALKVLREIDEMFTDDSNEETGFNLEFFEGCDVEDESEAIQVMKEASWAISKSADHITDLIRTLLDGEYCG